MNEKKKKFLIALDKLMQEYNVTLGESDNYDGMEDFIGTEYSFYDNKDIDVSLGDLLEEIHKAKQ